MNTPKKQRVEEFRLNRTSWKFFERKSKKLSLNWADRVLLEILKELQFMNDK